MTLDELADKMKEEVLESGKSVITFWDPYSLRCEQVSSIDKVPSDYTVANQLEIVSIY